MVVISSTEIRVYRYTPKLISSLDYKIGESFIRLSNEYCKQLRKEISNIHPVFLQLNFRPKNVSREKISYLEKRSEIRIISASAYAPRLAVICLEFLNGEK